MSSTKIDTKKKSKEARAPKAEEPPAEAASASPSPDPTKKRKRDTKEVEELEVDVNLPEPLSKKELRKAKKFKPTTSSGSKKRTENDSNDKEVASTEEAKRSNYGIWIGNLSWTTTKALLTEFFTANSSITAEDITRVNMPVPFKAAATQTQLKPQNKGFAYVDFATEEVLAAAMKLTESMLGGRRVLIKNAKSFEGRPEKKEGIVAESGPGAKPISQKPISKRVFVGNLSFDVTKEELSEHFNKAGKVVDLHMATFEDSGKCKGFAWVTFEETESAESAVRGWTRVPVDAKNEGEAASDDEDEDTDAGDAKKDSKNKKQKTRKWFINKLHGRPLRCEFAEDAQSRYKKRFGQEEKDGEVRKPRRQKGGGDAAGDAAEGFKRNNKKKSREDADMAPGAPSDFAKRRGRTAAPSKEEAYKTGAITEAKGTKVTFD